MAIYEIPKSRLNLDTIMQSGQCFSISKKGYIFEILSSDKAAYAIDSGNIYYIHYKEGSWDYWNSYFRLDTIHFKCCQSEFLNSQNEFIRRCAMYSDGMIILKQDLWEMIVSFIISQRRSIPSIKSSLARLRTNFGKERSFIISDDLSFQYHEFPNPTEILSNPVESIQEQTGIGYRAPYIKDAAEWFIENHHKLKSSKSYDESMELLKQIRGVGDKVASCVCLFGLNHTDSFPIDVWIQRVLDKELISRTDIEIASDKGFLQQIIFYYVINHKDQFI